MRRFRDFLVSEIAFGKQTTRIVGIYKLPDLGAATQLGKTPVGGYNSFGHMANWLGTQAKYNIRYPLNEHGIDPSKADSEVRSLSYEQFKSAIIDLASRIESIGSVIASKGTSTDDEHLTARLRHAYFRGQKGEVWEPLPKPQAHFDYQRGQWVHPDPTEEEDWVNNVEAGVDRKYIYRVDVRAFTGEVSGRGGTQGFKIGEALGVITPFAQNQPTSTTQPAATPAAQATVAAMAREAVDTENPLHQLSFQQNVGANIPNIGAPMDGQGKPINLDGEKEEENFDSHFNIDVVKLETEMHKSLKLFTLFERELQSWGAIGGWADTAMGYLGRPGTVKNTLGIDSMGYSGN